MAKAGKPKGFDNVKDPEQYLVAGPGGATRQTAEDAEASLTTNQGVIVADDQNTLKSGGRGPSLPEDFAFREAAKPLFAKAGIVDDPDEGVIELDAQPIVGQYIEAAKQQRVWAREARLLESDA